MSIRIPHDANENVRRAFQDVDNKLRNLGGDGSSDTEFLRRLDERIAALERNRDLTQIANLEVNGDARIENDLTVNGDILPSVLLAEDFISGSSAVATTIGLYGWTGYTSSGGSVSIKSASVAGHPGIMQLSTGVTGSAVTSVYHQSNYFIVQPQDVSRADADVYVTTDWPSFTYILFMTNSVIGVTDAIGFWAANGTANWHSFTTASSSTTSKDTGVAKATATWFNLEVRRTGSQSWDFYVDGVKVTSHSGGGENVIADTTGCQVCIPMVVGDGTDRQMWIDRVRAWRPT